MNPCDESWPFLFRSLFQLIVGSACSLLEWISSFLSLFPVNSSSRSPLDHYSTLPSGPCSSTHLSILPSISPSIHPFVHLSNLFSISSVICSPKVYRVLSTYQPHFQILDLNWWTKDIFLKNPILWSFYSGLCVKRVEQDNKYKIQANYIVLEGVKSRGESKIW